MSIIDEVRAARTLPRREVARAIRIAAGVTQQDLADELGTSRNTISRWETGERNPSPRLRARYAMILRQLNEAA